MAIAAGRRVCLSGLKASRCVFSRRVLSSSPTFNGENMPGDDNLKPFYALGVNVGMQTSLNLKTILTREEIEVMVKGYSDFLLDKVDQPNDMLAHFGPGLNALMTGRADALLKNTVMEGEKFAADYLSNYPDAIRTESKLVYHETEAGTGAQPSGNCTVTAHYTGKFVDGRVFDSSHGRGEPLEFAIDKVIEGWTEGLQLMREGGKATLIIPHQIAYGEKGSPPVIPPVTTLVFDVHLISVKENKESA